MTVPCSVVPIDGINVHPGWSMAGSATNAAIRALELGDPLTLTMPTPLVSNTPRYPMVHGSPVPEKVCLDCAHRHAARTTAT